MQATFIYMPVLRVRSHELELLKTFEFGQKICPYIEIVKEKDRPRKLSYSQLYRCLLLAIKSDTVFVDIPIHLNLSNRTDPKVISFLNPMKSLENRNSSLLSLAPSEKMVPVISSYHTITGETGTIKKQVDRLRPTFSRLAFRISAKDPEFESEFDQVVEHLTAADHLIVDFDDDKVDKRNEYLEEIKDKLSKISVCPIVAIRSAIPNELKYRNLIDDEEVAETDNRLMKEFKLLHATAFGDYAGIKKDLLPKGAPDEKKVTFGCIFYDGTDNNYYGFKGANPGFAELKNTVIPGIKKSKAAKRMKDSNMEFLSNGNLGWRILHDPKIGRPGDLKRVSMEHYIYCVKTLIEKGGFD